MSTGRVAFLVAAEGTEQVELTVPWKAVEDAGLTPVLISTRAGEVQAVDHLDKSDRFRVDEVVSETDHASFDALVLPGGVSNPDALRTDADAVAFVREFMRSKRPVAAVCHAPWVLTETGELEGRRLTSSPSLRTDLLNAGAEWVDEEVVVDASGTGPLITSRSPEDLPAFCDAVLTAIQAHPADLVE